MIMYDKMLQLQYPLNIENLYTSECISYRSNFNDRMHRYLEDRLSYNKEPILEEIIEEQNLTVPFSNVLDQLESPIEINAVAAEKEQKVFLLMQLKNHNGMGKTGIILQMLGIDVPYEKIPNSISNLENAYKVMLSSKHEDTKLLCSDMIYCGLQNGKLAIAAPIGEYLIAQWDLARHIFRVKSPTHFGGKNRMHPIAREYLEVLGKNYFMDSILFGSFTCPYPLDYIFIINRKEMSYESDVIVKRISSNKKQLANILNKNPAYNKAQFWRINYEEHLYRSLNIIEKINTIPKIYTIDLIPAPVGDYPVKKAAGTILNILEKP